jgi:hypothetical protein
MMSALEQALPVLKAGKRLFIDACVCFLNRCSFHFEAAKV